MALLERADPWSALLPEWRRDGGRDLKKWLREKLGVTLSTNRIGRIAREQASVHPELQRLGETIEEVGDAAQQLGHRDI